MVGGRGRESSGQARRVGPVGLTVGAVVVVVALCVVWWLVGGRGEEPVADPTRTPAEATSTPTPTSEELPPALELGPPIDEPGVPTYFAMPDGALDLAEPGWVLATYLVRPQPFTVAPPEHSSDEFVFLVRPDGTRLLAVRIPEPADLGQAGTTWTEHELVSWEAGATTAVVREVVHTVSADVGSESITPGAVVTLDLLTGDVTAGAAEPPVALGVPNARGDLWLTADGAVVDGTGTSLGAIDGPTASGWCRAVQWWTADSVLAACVDEDPFETETPHLQLDPRLVTIDVPDLATGDGTVLRPVAPGEPWPWDFGVAPVADGVVVAQGTVFGPGEGLGASCPTGVYLIDARGAQRLPSSDDAEVDLNLYTPAVVDGTVYVSATGGCSGDARPSVLTSYDVATGTSTELVGAPPRGDAAEYPWLQGLTSYTVAR